MDSTLPTTTKPTSVPESDGHQQTTTVKPLVLVVDDHNDTRDLLRFVIEAIGCRVVEARDGQEAVRLAATMLPDLIVMDTALPGIDGFNATKCIRQLEAFRRMPIIFLSGHAQPQLRDAALAAGGDEYLVKPVDLGELERALRKQLPPTRSARA